MSETEQKEVEFVTGTIGGVNQRAADKWQVEVATGGSYAKKLWTKDADLVKMLASRLNQSETFRCNVSHWTNNEGKPVRSLWIDAVGGSLAAEGAASAVATPSRVQSTEYQRDLSPDAVKRIEESQLRTLKAEAWRTTAALFAEPPAPARNESDLRLAFNHFKFFQALVLSDIAGDLVTQADSARVEFGTPERDDIPFS